MSRPCFFIQPVDTLSLRGNCLFGDAGSFGESLFPPKPSVLSGAFRSFLLAHHAEDFNAFAQGHLKHRDDLAQALGTPAQPGTFTIQAVFPAYQKDGQISVCMPLPADVVVCKENKENKASTVRRLEPTAVKPDRWDSSSWPKELPCVPILKQGQPAKPESGFLLTEEGNQAYLAGEALDARKHLKRAGELWSREIRVGIGLDADTRTVSEGKLFSLEHTVVQQAEYPEGIAAGLIVAIEGLNEKLLPNEGFLRLGGDGKAARFCRVPSVDLGFLQPPLDAIRKSNRLKMILQSPCLFSKGWLPEGVETENDRFVFKRQDLSATLVCAAVPRYEVISGWNLAQGKPKVAERTAPAGSVYWFELQEDNPEALDEAINKMIIEGLWSESADPTRKAEGYNRVLITNW